MENQEQQSQEPASNEPVNPETPEPTEISTEARQLAMFAHLSGILVGFIGPLIIWLIKREELPFVDRQGKEALNFQINVLIAAAIGAVTTVICIGFVLLPAVIVANVVFCIIAGIAANEGKEYQYPFMIRLIK